MKTEQSGPAGRQGRPMDEAAMTALAARLAKAIRPPLCIHLEGDLGAGKTTFVRALIQGLGYRGRVKSPTYGLLEHYDLPGFKVLHLDLYRIGDPDELEFLGIVDLYDEGTILLAEWPERGGGALPPADVELRFQHSGNHRLLMCQAHSSSGNALCHSFNRLL